MFDSGHLLIILHEVPAPSSPARVARLYWRDPSGTWRTTTEGQKPGQGDGLLALRRQLETAQAAITALDEAVDRATSADEIYEVLRRATPLHRSTRNLAAALQSARDAVEDKEIISLRDAASDLERTIELVVTDARNAREHLEAKAAEQQAQFAKRSAEAQHRLNLLAALFFPVTAIGSILGINLTTGLEGQGPAIFWGLVVGAVCVGFAVRGVIAR